MADSSPESQPRRAGVNPFSVLTVMFLLLSCLTLACVGAVFAVPGLVPEQYRPPTEVVIAIFTLPPASSTPTPSNTSSIATLPPEWTATPSPTVSDTPAPSDTPTQTNTPPPLSTFTDTPTITPTPSRTHTSTPTGPTPMPSRTRSAFQYTMQNNQPTYTQNFANTAGCNWMGIAGQAFDLGGAPVQNLIVHVEGGGLNFDVVTGDPRAAAYGPGAYEAVLSNKTADTTNTYRIQLRTITGQALSDVFNIQTFADCKKNLILVFFVQNH